MKTIKLPFLNMKCAMLCFIFIFSFSFCEGQTWLWAKGAINDTAGSGVDVTDLTTDNAGNIFETGVFGGKVSFGNINLSTKPYEDAFLVKFTNSGTPVWGVAPLNTGIGVGGAGGISIATDKTGDICMTGEYSGTMRIGSNNFPSNGYYDLFVAMFNPSGALIWDVYSQNGVSGSMGPNSVTIDNSGNTYLTGLFADTITIGGVHFHTGNTPSFFLAKFDINGNALWVQTAIDSNSVGSTVVTDTSGNVYVAGQFFDSLTIGTKSVRTHKCRDVFLAKFTSSGNIVWLKADSLPSSRSSAYYNYFAGQDDFGGRYLSIDNAEKLYWTAAFSDTVYVGPFTFNNQFPAIYLAKYNTSGDVLWVKESSAANTAFTFCEPYSISCNNLGSLFLCGSFQDTMTFGSIKLVSDSMEPSFLYKLDTAGNAICASAIDNYNDDNNCVARDPFSNGVFFSGDIIVYPFCNFGGYKIADSGYKNADESGFLAKWACDTTEGINKINSPTNPISLFPNPSTGAFTIEMMNEDRRMKNIEIYNVLGEKVYSNSYQPLANSQQLITIDLNQPSGIYLYRILQKDGSLIGEGKVIIAK